MDSRGRWIENVFIERLWRNLKYKEVYLKAYDHMSDAKHGSGDSLGFYNTKRPHQSFKNKTPDRAYFEGLEISIAA